MRAKLTASLPERLWSRVDRSDDGCWEWQGSSTSHGYGVLRYQGKLYGAHRVAYEVTNGPIPEGMVVCHRCDNPACCRPDHLFLGTKADNTLDMMAKRRHAPYPIRPGEASPFARLTADQVEAIRRAVASGALHRDVAAQYGVHRSTVTSIMRGRTWR